MPLFKKIWDALQATGNEAVRLQWQRLLEGEYTLLQDALVPTGQQARTYPCGVTDTLLDCEGAYVITDGKLVGAWCRKVYTEEGHLTFSSEANDANHLCRYRLLSDDDAALLRFDIPKFWQSLPDEVMSSIELVAEEINILAVGKEAWQVGSFNAADNRHFRVLFCPVTDRNKFYSVLDRAQVQFDHPFAMICVNRKICNKAITKRLANNSAESFIVGLEDLIIYRDGSIVEAGTLSDALERFETENPRHANSMAPTLDHTAGTNSGVQYSYTVGAGGCHIVFEDEEVTVNATLGFKYIGYLLGHPGQSFYPSDLVRPFRPSAANAQDHSSGHSGSDDDDDDDDDNNVTAVTSARDVGQPSSTIGGSSGSALRRRGLENQKKALDRLSSQLKSVREELDEAEKKGETAKVEVKAKTISILEA